MTVPPSQPPFVASKISQKIKKEMALFPNLLKRAWKENYYLQISFKSAEKLRSH
jgi:hypothetical protein